MAIGISECKIEGSIPMSSMDAQFNYEVIKSLREAIKNDRYHLDDIRKGYTKYKKYTDEWYKEKEFYEYLYDAHRKLLDIRLSIAARIHIVEA